MNTPSFEEFSQNRKQFEDKIESLKKLHEKDIGSLLKEVKNYQKCFQALQTQHSKLGNELISIGQKLTNEWGKGFSSIGSTFLEMETFFTQLNNNIHDLYVTPMSNKLTQEIKIFSSVEKKMQKKNKSLDSDIVKTGTNLKENKKQDENTPKIIEEVKKKFIIADQKREEMLQVLNYIEEEKCNSWFKSCYMVLKSQNDFFQKCKSKIEETMTSCSSLEKREISKENIVGLEEFYTSALVEQQQSQEEMNLDTSGVGKEDKGKKKITKPRSTSFSKITGSFRRKKSNVLPLVNKDTKPAPLTEAEKNALLVPEGGILCRAVFDYTAERDDEIDLKIGDMVTVIKKPQEDWWIGLVGTNRGLFPATFVEQVPEEENKMLDEGINFEKRTTRNRTQATF